MPEETKKKVLEGEEKEVETPETADKAEETDKPVEEPTEEEKPEETPPPVDEKPKSEPEPKVDNPSEIEQLKEENLRLKTKVTAMGLGIKSDCMEDAVVLAENLVKQGEQDIETALNAVIKKYPDWKDGKAEIKKASGFKVGADSPEAKPIPDEKLKSAFGIKPKK